MIWLLTLKCFFIKKNIYVFLPETDTDSHYKLKKYKTIKYESLQKCIKNEVCKIPGVNEKEILEEFDNFTKEPRFEEIKKIDQEPYLLNKDNKLTYDELLAIYLYTTWNNSNSFDFIGNFKNTLAKGSTGYFNCYFEYFYNGLTKINPKYLKSDQLLYRGIMFENESLIQKYKKLKVGDGLSSQSFTSTTTIFSLAATYSIFSKKDIVFVIHQNQKNAHIIEQFSRFSYENEVIYPPETKFVVKEGIKDKYCSSLEDLSKCADKKPEKHKEYDYIRIIEIEEKDYVPSYEEEANPFSSFGIKTGVSYWIFSFIYFLGFFLI